MHEVLILAVQTGEKGEVILSKKAPLIDQGKFDQVEALMNHIHYVTRYDAKHTHIDDARKEFRKQRDAFLEAFRGYYGSSKIVTTGFSPWTPSEDEMVKTFYKLMKEFLNYLHDILEEACNPGLIPSYQKMWEILGRFGMLIQLQ
jgi:hypothetical protein